MDFTQIIQEQCLGNAPIGLGGCRASDLAFDACGFDLVVFDEKTGASRVIRHGSRLVVIHHASISEADSGRLLQHDNLKIIQDESWELHMLQARIREKRKRLFLDFARNCLIESIFCCQKTADALDGSDVFAPCWQKCALVYLADAIAAINCIRPSPSHMLDSLRKMGKNAINDHIATATQSIGIERATPTLLERMTKSAIGLSDLAGSGTSELIRAKHDFFVENSMLSDCYFYLEYANRDNFTRIKDLDADMFYLFKVAFDVEAGSDTLLKQSDMLKNASNSILEAIAGR